MTDVFSDDIGDLHMPRPGEQVQVKRLGGKLATVVEVSKDDGTVLVQYGKVRFRVDRRGVQTVEERPAASSSSTLKKQVRIPGNLDNFDEREDEDLSYGPMLQTSKNTVDLRGMRVEEASQALYMAIAAREPYSLLFIIHGMGTGVLKEHVVEVLKNHPRVVKFEQESPMNYGCTVAFIK
uniref:Adenosinetriphosphatase n=2 Tax=Opuntia streptacantha TaxID=393608 RepID=A0A7C9EZV4_OPUST